ncbi:ArsR/SmtB family transcription factor [Chondromyces crocatus]|uniref:ArsR family transcriptional regulator n=1 Tax=Chondromyces crocatus TaxID=52 RepID=A0A0K1EKI6_CHOCO|nr:ArsR family transcriptional regulator [Chondromyces crocatus]AKT41182.1 ArsR family transcriptional regulator [Chondromyces crocatus]
MSGNDYLYAGLASLAASLSSPTRLRALHLLFQGAKSIGRLAELLGESEANMAAHMKALRAVGLVTACRQGKYVFQEANRECGLRLFLALRGAGEVLVPAVRLLEQEGGDESASALRAEALEEHVGPRRALLADLRPLDEYEAGHLPGASSVPFASLDARLQELPKRRRILVYCRGKYCPNARRGTLLLRQHGLRAERLQFGVPEWLASGRALVEGSG